MRKIVMVKVASFFFFGTGKTFVSARSTALDSYSIYSTVHL
jgi:hypothetical protein